MRTLLIFLLASSCLHVSAQKKGRQLIDSLLIALPKMKDDTNKVKAITQIVRTQYALNPLAGVAYAQQALQLAEKINWKKGIANCHNNLGLMIADTGNNALAITHFEKSLVLNTELDSKFNIINNLNNLGRSYQRQSDFSKASDYYFKALAVAEEIKSNEQISLVASNITVSFFAQSNYAKSIEYAEMELKYAQLAKIPNYVASSLMQLGTCKLNIKDTLGAKKDLSEALKIYQELNNQPKMALVLSNMGDAQYPDYKKSIDLYMKAGEIFKATGPASVNAITNTINIGKAYYQLAVQSAGDVKNDYLNKSATYLQEAKKFVDQIDNKENTANIDLALADLETAKGNYKRALDYYKTGYHINDSLFSQDRKNEIAGLEGKHNIALKDDEITLNKLTLLNQRKTQFGLIAGLCFLGIIGGLFYWQSRSRKKTNTTLMVLNNQLDEANKVKARFFGILSHDLRSPVVNLVHFLHLQKNSPDLLTEETQVTYQQNITSSAEDLLNTMEAMLLWSKEQMENFKPNIKVIAISSLFEYIQKFFGQTVKVKIIFQDPAGLKVSVDENYLRTIMQNLTANAVKALKNTPDATIQWAATKNGNTTILSITDNGPGIGAEQVKTLFDDSVANNEKNGFGLHLIRDLAKAIQYKIAVQSEPGKGTTFILSGAAV
jgi:signal transduction histidine kinase